MAFRIETVGDYAFQVVDTLSPTPPLMYLPRQGTWYEEQSLQSGFVKFYGTSGTNEDNIKLYSRFESDFKGFPLAECVDDSDTPFTDVTFRAWVGANLGGFNTGGSTPSPTPSLENRVVVTQSNYQTTLSNIDSTKEYFIDGVVDVASFNITPPSDPNGMLIVGYDFDTSKIISSKDNFTLIQSSPIVGGDLVLLGMTLSQFDKTYLEVSGLYGQINSLGNDFTNDDPGNTDYKVFSYDDTGVSGNYFVVINSNIGNFWVVIETPANPSTYVNGTNLSPITNTESVSFTSETQEGKNVPDSTDSKVSYSGGSGGSGNIKIRDLAIEISGSNSEVYDLTPIDNFRAIEVNRVNYNNCTSLGEINGYRQGFEQGSGRFGGTPTLTFSGNWGGGYVYTDTIVRILDSGMTEPLFREGTNFVMNSRFRSNANIDLPSFASFLDFNGTNFPNTNTLQLNGCTITRNGVFNSEDSNITPNTSEGDVISDWNSNTGIRNTIRCGALNVDTQVPTVLVQNIWNDVNAVWGSSELQHMDSPTNGELRFLDQTERDFELKGQIIVSGGAGDDLEFRIAISRNDGVTFDEFGRVFQRNVNFQFFGEDRADLTIIQPLKLNLNDRVKLQVRNITDSINITALQDSYFLMEQR